MQADRIYQFDSTTCPEACRKGRVPAVPSTAFNATFATRIGAVAPQRITQVFLSKISFELDKGGTGKACRADERTDQQHVRRIPWLH
jgi:hypothetical protein